MSLGSKIKHFVWSKRFLINLIVLVVVYFVIVQGTIWYLDSSTRHGEKVRVPYLVGKNVKHIGSMVEDLGLNYEVLDSIYDPSKVEGTIISQDPRSTDSTNVFIKEGRTVRLRVSKRSRMVEMPRCIDKSQRFAENILRNMGLKYTVEFRPSIESDGAVIQQLYRGKPIADKTKLPIGSSIKLVVGRNLSDQSIAMPNLVGLTICEAKQRLGGVAGMNLLVVCENCVTAADSCGAMVETQNPEYIDGAMISAGSTMTVVARKLP